MYNEDEPSFLEEIKGQVNNPHNKKSKGKNMLDRSHHQEYKPFTTRKPRIQTVGKSTTTRLFSAAY